MKIISIRKERYEQMKKELAILRHTRLYKRLLEFEGNISKGKKFTRKDLGF